MEELDFFIQASSPRYRCESLETPESLGEAVEYSFPMLTESMFMTWKGHQVHLSYKYDISVIVEDLLELLDELRQLPTGEREVFWGSDTFNGCWKLKWKGGQLKVQADWRDVGAGLEQLLATELAIPVGHFVAEWKRPLGIVCSALKAADYTVEQLPGLQMLKDLYEAIPQEGVLYRSYQA